MPDKKIQSRFDRILGEARKKEISMDLTKRLLLGNPIISKEISKLTVAIVEGASYNNNGEFIF